MTTYAIWNAVFLLFLMVVAVGDAIGRRIPNRVIVSWASLALVCMALNGWVGPWQASPSEAFLGAVGALLGLLPFYAKRWMAAGDVKLASVIGLWVGWHFLIPIWLASLLPTILHGLWIAKSDGRAIGKTNSVGLPRKMVPYGTWLCLATFLIWIYQTHSKTGLSTY